LYAQIEPKLAIGQRHVRAEDDKVRADCAAYFGQRRGSVRLDVGDREIAFRARNLLAGNDAQRFRGGELGGEHLRECGREPCGVGAL
jgi:hypothetical protein